MSGYARQYPRPAAPRNGEHGITGLETAIILIAFVVVAAVFAFVVLSTGLFSSERGKEAVYAGLPRRAARWSFRAAWSRNSNRHERDARSASTSHWPPAATR